MIGPASGPEGRYDPIPRLSSLEQEFFGSKVSVISCPRVGGLGRDGPFAPPPAQIRRCSITAYGSYHPNLTAVFPPAGTRFVRLTPGPRPEGHAPPQKDGGYNGYPSYRPPKQGQQSRCGEAGAPEPGHGAPVILELLHSPGLLFRLGGDEHVPFAALPVADAQSHALPGILTSQHAGELVS